MSPTLHAFSFADGKFHAPYVPPFDTPLYWQNEQSGLIPGAVKAYLNRVTNTGPEPTADQMRYLCGYLAYYVHAPCWSENLKTCEEMLAELQELRERSKTLASVESCRRFIEECLELGLDPL